jgi:cytidylate kinase
MAVITISREFGSEGSSIAEHVAKNLGYHLADKHTLATMLSEFGLVEFHRVYESVPTFWSRFDAEVTEQRNIIIKMLNQAIMALAHHGNIVIVGRGGFSVLQGLADVLHVRIQAPLELRIRRVTDLPEIAEPSRAEQLVKDNDKLQRDFIKSVYDAQWDSTKGFDLIIDTGKISKDLATSWIIQAAGSLHVPDESGLRTAANLDVDRILAATVAEFFSCELVHA